MRTTECRKATLEVVSSMKPQWQIESVDAEMRAKYVHVTEAENVASNVGPYPGFLFRVSRPFRFRTLPIWSQIWRFCLAR